MSLLTEASLLVTPNAYKATKLYSIIPSNGNGDFTVTRTSTATRVNSSGLVESVALNVPQIDYSLGGCPNILIEPQRTNTIRNSTNVGAAVGAPGTLPTNWTEYAPSLTRTIVSTGTENGLNYIDIRYSGTTTDIQTQIIFDTGISTSPSVAWAQSAYLKLVSGTLPTTQLATRPTGPLLPDYSTNVTVTSSLTRFFNTFIVAATATAVSPRIYFNHSIGTAVDFTIRIAGTQLELGNYATSFIPTTTTSLTRNLGQILRNNVFTNGWITAAGGTWFVELRGNVPVVRDQSTSGIFLNTGLTSTIGNGIVLRNAGSTMSRMGIFTVVAGGLSSNLYTIPTDTAKIAIKWNGTTADIFVNAVKVVAATPFTPTAMENLIGEGANRAVYINEMALFTTPLTDTQCIALTT